MSITLKFALFQCAIILPFFAGSLLRGRSARPRELSRSLLRVNIIGLEPLIVLWCTWQIKLSADLAVLPLMGLALVAAGVIAGSVAATLLGLSGARRTSFLISCSLSNHGFTMGGALCYFFFGEQGLAYSVILVLYFIPYVYGLVFPYAKAGAGGRIFPRGELKALVFSFQNMPLFAMAAGLLLNLAAIARPAIALPLDELLLASISLYYFTLGLTFTGINIGETRRELAALSLIKFAAVPGAAFLLLWVLPLAPAIRAVIQLQSFMPAAIYSVVAAVLFNQDSELASSLFVCNTVIFLVVVLPLIFFWA